ncbi:hypothetical protein VKT23_013345 [Stygiomarasmius scandens]|uniref:Cryptic loci regulator 2 N-terminal domain-containing protein n=1 Tax=Marasmiellus scandens TaxID=2682957 RepID=A0ABR1J387_9AGAR
MSAPTQSSSHPILTKFPLSDGSSTTWPTNNTRILASDGSFDYYQVIGEEDPEFARWCTQISEQLQKVSPDGSKYALKELPEGYRLFRHLRGTEGKYRSDRYLYGSTSCTRFRSPSEFISHAIWLLTHPSPSSNTASSSSTTLDQARPVLDHNTCKCRYSISNSKPNRSPRKLKARPSNASLVLNDETPTPSPAKIKSKSGHVASVEGDILDQNSSIVQEQKAGTTVPVTKPPGEEESGERNENSGKDEEQRETEESTSAVSDHSQVNGALVLRGIDKQNEVGQAEEPVVIIKVQDELSLATIAVEQTEKTVLMNGKNEEGMMETDELVVPTKMREDADEEEFNGKESISIKGLDEPSEPMEAVIKKESVDQKELKESVAVVGQDRVDAPAITADETEDRSFSFTALSLRRRGDTPEETPAAIPSTPVFSSNSALVQGTNEIVFPISDGDTSTWPKNVETLSISDVTGFNNDNASSGSPASLPSGSQLDKTESSNPEFADSPNSRKNSPKYRVIQANERSMKTYLENVGHGVAQKLKDKLGLDGKSDQIINLFTRINDHSYAPCVYLAVTQATPNMY